MPVVYVVVGCHWTTAPVLARSALLRSRLLLPGRRSCTIVTVDFTQEAQDRFPQIYQLPAHLHQHGQPPPATPLNYVPWVLICFLFNYVIRRRHFGWWSKYNCELIS